jgi:hypothetical protein
MAKKYELPDLSNATPTSLIDEIGKLSTMQSYIAKSLKVHKETLYTKFGGKDKIDAPIDGDTFVGNIGCHEATRVNQDYVKQMLPIDKHPEYYTTTPVYTLRTSNKTNPELDKWIASLKAELDLD